MRVLYHLSLVYHSMVILITPILYQMGQYSRPSSLECYSSNRDTGNCCSRLSIQSRKPDVENQRTIYTPNIICPSETKTDFATSQIRTLLTFAHYVYLVPVPELWLETENLVRHATAIKTHRDPSETKAMSTYGDELRRRL